MQTTSFVCPLGKSLVISLIPSFAGLAINCLFTKLDKSFSCGILFPVGLSPLLLDLFICTIWGYSILFVNLRILYSIICRSTTVSYTHLTLPTSDLV